MKKLVWAVAAAGTLSASAFFEKITPESAGIPSQAIEDYIRASENELDGIHSFVLIRHGDIVAEGYWAPFSADRTHLLFSHSKSFTSTAAGLLADEGKLDLDERLVDIFPELVPEKPDPNLAQLRVRDLLTMNAGQNHEAVFLAPDGDWVKAFMSNKIERKPGSGFKYDSCATHVVAAIVEKKTGKKLMDYLEEKFFRKLGITGAWSNVSPTGVACGGWGMNLKTRDLARFGLCYLNEGRWLGEQVISRDWVRLATSLQTQTKYDRPGDSDWSQGYGFQFWRCRHNCFRADGAFGQYTVVMPDKDAVISITAGLSDMGKELDLVWKHLLPAMQDQPLPENKAASDALSRHCEALAFPTVGGQADGEKIPYGTKFSLSGEQKRFFFTDVVLAKKGSGWEVALTDQMGPQKFPVGYGKWEYGEISLDKQPYESLGTLVGVQHTAASGAWTKPDTFEVKMFLVDTPSWMRFVFTFKPDGSLEFVTRFWGWGGGDSKLTGTR